MAPSTRLRSNPELRVHYGVGSQPGSRDNPIAVESLPAPAATVRRRPKPTAAPVLRTTRVTKPKAPAKEAKKAAPKPKKKERPAKQDCSICATEKCTKRSFKVPSNANACDHLATICVSCIQKMLRTKVTEHQLSVAELACPFPDCDYALDLPVLKMVVSKAVFEYYDQALLKHLLSADQSYISCLSETCDMYFSIEDCSKTPRKGGSKKARKQNVACPYCDFEICLTCNRPWGSHGSGDCSQAKAKEDEASEKTLKEIGAKPCPSCGINIQKEYGCDHMNCQQCNHHFCWQCLVPYNSNVRHADHCPHGRINAAADPRNWVADNLNLEQLNGLIRRGVNAHPPPGGPGIPLGQLQNGLPPVQPPAFPNAMLQFFGFGGNNAPPRPPPTPPPPAPVPQAPPPQAQPAPQALQPPRAHGTMQAHRRDGRRVALAEMARRFVGRG